MRTNNPAYPGVVLQVVVATNVAPINDQAAVTNITIVAYVSVNHKHTVATDSGLVTEFIRTTVDGDSSSEDIIVTNADLGQAIIVREVLRRRAYDDIGEEFIIGAYNNVTGKGDTIVQHAAGADLYLWAYYAERPD